MENIKAVRNGREDQNPPSYSIHGFWKKGQREREREG